MRMRLFPLAVALGALALALSSACASYEMTDRPICGDQLLPEGFTCGLWPAPCGCASDLRCGYQDNTLACVKPGTHGVDAPCTEDSECAKGTWCDGTRCRQTCFESLDCGDDAAVLCRLLYDDKDNKLVGYCHRDCDPVSPQAPTDPRLETCRADEGCFVDPTEGSANCTRPVGSTPVGAKCTKAAECVPGAQCIESKGCEKLCWVGATGGCPDRKTCKGLTTDTGSVGVLDRMLGVCE